MAPDAAPSGAAPLLVRVVCALPCDARGRELRVPAGCTAREAVTLALGAGLDLSGTGVDPATAPLGLFGERVGDGTPLRAGDRVEIYRPLVQDPMARRRRVAAAAKHA